MQNTKFSHPPKTNEILYSFLPQPLNKNIGIKMYKIWLMFWRMVELGILLSIFIDLYNQKDQVKLIFFSKLYVQKQSSQKNHPPHTQKIPSKSPQNPSKIPLKSEIPSLPPLTFISSITRSALLVQRVLPMRGKIPVQIHSCTFTIICWTPVFGPKSIYRMSITIAIRIHHWYYVPIEIVKVI